MSNAPIAIIGMACIFPQAPDLAGFWRNILAGTDAVGEPQDEWEAQRYLDSLVEWEPPRQSALL